MTDGLAEMAGGAKQIKHRIPLLIDNAKRGADAIGRFTSDIFFNGGKKILSNQPVHDYTHPPLIKAFLRSNVFGNATFNIDHISISGVGARIAKSFSGIKLTYDALSWNQVAKWTPDKAHNYEMFQRLKTRLYNRFWPHYTPSNYHKKFIVGGNCKIADGIVNVTTRLVGYCVDDFIERQSIKTEPTNKDSFFYKFKGRIEYKSMQPGGKLRPRIISPPKRKLLPKMNRHVYRRATANPDAGAGDFNLFRWMISIIEDLFNIDILQNTDGLVKDIKDWFANPNTSVESWPDVGFAYWVRFPFTCKFPENLNCSIGSGLERALIDVTWIFIIIFIASAIFFPSIISILGFLGGIAIWGFIVLAVGFHFSPACIALWPSFLSADGEFGFPSIMSGQPLPECFLSETVAVLDKYITQDYSFIINQTYVNGDVSPTCPNYIDFINCNDVGVADGLQNMLYLMYRWLGPGFCEVIIGIASTTIGMIFPSMRQYLVETLARFKNASPTEMMQQDFCAKLSIGSLSLVFLIMLPFVLFLLFMVPAVIDVFAALWGVFRASPLFYFITQEDGNEVVDIPGENMGPTEDDEEEDEGIYDNTVASSIALYIRDNLVPGYKKKKLKKE